MQIVRASIREKCCLVFNINRAWVVWKTEIHWFLRSVFGREINNLTKHSFRDIFLYI